MTAYESGFTAQVVVALDAKRLRLERWLTSLAIEADEFAATAREAGETEMAQGFERAAISLREAARAQRGGK